MCQFGIILVLWLNFIHVSMAVVWSHDSLTIFMIALGCLMFFASQNYSSAFLCPSAKMIINIAFISIIFGLWVKPMHYPTERSRSNWTRVASSLFCSLFSKCTISVSLQLMVVKNAGNKWPKSYECMLIFSPQGCSTPFYSHEHPVLPFQCKSYLSCSSLL